MKKKESNGTAASVLKTLAIIGLLLAAVVGVGCVYYSHLLQGIIILVCDIGIVGIMLLASSIGELDEDQDDDDHVRPEARNRSKAGRPNGKFKTGSVKLRCTKVMCQVSRGYVREQSGYGTVICGDNGLVVEIGKYRDGHSWESMQMYQHSNDVVLIGFEDASTLSVGGLSKLKMQAFLECLAEHQVHELTF